MRAIASVVFMMASGVSPAAAPDSRVLESFDRPSGALDWRVVNDNVMGGRSEGGFDIADGELRFSGRTNTNGGGFSSLRTAPTRLDLSDFDGVRVIVRGDGRRYTWRLATDATWRGLPVAYWADFDTTKGEWVAVELPFKRFVPRVRGQRLDRPPIDSAHIAGMGIMIYDGRDGPFDIRLERVEAYATPVSFDLVSVRWTRRVLVLSAPSANDPLLARSVEAIDATRDEFEARDLLLVVLIADGESSVGGAPLLASDAAALRSALELPPETFGLVLVGKDGGIKYASAKPTVPADIYTLIDGMPMRRNEMRDAAGDDDS